MDCSDISHHIQKKTIVDTEPYSTSVFVEALTDCFFARPRSYGYRIVSHFRSSLAEAPHEKEIPAAMLALVATAVRLLVAHIYQY